MTIEILLIEIFSINKISNVMIVGKFEIMRSGPKTVTVVYLFEQKGVETVHMEWIVSDVIKDSLSAAALIITQNSYNTPRSALADTPLKVPLSTL